jgi:hypothetical protein
LFFSSALQEEKAAVDQEFTDIRRREVAWKSMLPIDLSQPAVLPPEFANDDKFLEAILADREMHE